MIAINRNYGRKPKGPSRRPVDATSQCVNMIYDPGPEKAKPAVAYDTGKPKSAKLPSVVVNFPYDSDVKKSKGDSTNPE